MKAEFLQPRFVGARFEESTLPIELARDLAAYEALVTELAKALYLQDHPERRRVPKGFASKFQLHLERIDDGSAKPMLSIVTAGALALAPDLFVNGYFTSARDIITQCIAAPAGEIPQNFPQPLLTHFNQIGRSLRDGEQMEFPQAGAPAAVLNSARRKELVLAAGGLYEDECELSGTIVEADWERATFRLRLDNGDNASIPLPLSFDGEVRNYGGRLRHQVTVKGVAAFDAGGHLQKVIWIDSLELQPDYQLAARFDELGAIENGWHDGTGLALDPGALSQIVSRMIGHYPETLPLPAIVPTPGGNLLFEWETEGEPSVDIHLANMAADFHMFLDEGEIEKEFNLTNADTWPQFFAFLSQHIKNI